MSSDQAALRERRLELVREHMRSENDHEFDLLGTHKGELRGIAANGRSFRCRMCALFLFEPGGERIVCERIYFDQATIAQQLLGDAGG
jgi:predicted ester cyclase